MYNKFLCILVYSCICIISSCVFLYILQDSQQLPSPVKFDLPTSTGSLPPSEVIINIFNN